MRIKSKFNELNEKKKAALITYITAGDPSLNDTKDIILELQSSGADIIELGIPFSDPMADGPAIQLASERAIKSGATLTKILRLVKEIRKQTQIPIILFGYYNPFFIYGLDKFCIDAKKAGVDGVLVVDLPPEESSEFKKFLDKQNLDLVFLLAPTSTSERIKLVSKNGSGFIYLVSVTGVTGQRPNMNYSLQPLISEIRKYSDLPVGVGFGVSSDRQAREISGFSDAVIVGSALVKIIEKNGYNKDAVLKEMGDFTKKLSKACFRV
jgi:tryptophan synthase alpha chain